MNSTPIQEVHDKLIAYVHLHKNYLHGKQLMDKASDEMDRLRMHIEPYMPAIVYTNDGAYTLQLSPQVGRSDIIVRRAKAISNEQNP